MIELPPGFTITNMSNFDEWAEQVGWKPFTKCECGADTTYGREVARVSGYHADWCPCSPNYKASKPKESENGNG